MLAPRHATLNSKLFPQQGSLYRTFVLYKLNAHHMLATAYLVSDQLRLTPPCGTNYFFLLVALGDTSPGVDVGLITSLQLMLEILDPTTK